MGLNKFKHLSSISLEAKNYSLSITAIMFEGLIKRQGVPRCRCRCAALAGPKSTWSPSWLTGTWEPMELTGGWGGKCGAPGGAGGAG